MKPPVDPLLFAKKFWPKVRFTREQCQIIYSVVYDDETIVPAGNQLGKDFVAAFIVLWFFLTKHPVRVVTTSATEKHVDVLWDEINRLIDECEVPLRAESGGPLIVTHHKIRKLVKGKVDAISYVRGIVASADGKGEGLSGHHAPYTLFVCDEASGVLNAAYEAAQGWAKRMLIIGNPNPTSNFFYRGVKGGSIAADYGEGLFRRIIQIRAEDSTNVRCGQSIVDRQGIEIIAHPSFEEMARIVPGIIEYREYLRRRKVWDAVRQKVGLDAEFPEDAGTLMFPPEWILRANKLFAGYRDKDGKKIPPWKPSDHERRTLGVDSAEGNDNSAWSVCDRFGLLHLKAIKTHDTTVIVDQTIDLMNRFHIKGNDVFFDRGGGGKQHADRLRRQGHKVNTVGFGESVNPEKHRGTLLLAHRKDLAEEQYAYKNRRAQMYGMLRLKLNPENELGFRISREHERLLQELAPIPVRYDEENRMYLLPKRKRDAKDTRETLIDIIGHSPDEADATVLAVYGLEVKSFRKHVEATAL